MPELLKPPTNPVEWIDVEPDVAGQRIDNFLLTYLKGVPRSQVYRILRRGEVRVNKGRIKPHYRLQAGDRVRIPPLSRSEPQPSGQPSNKTLERLESAVLYEDARIIILNKPSGMAVHGGSGLSYGVIEAVRAWRSELTFVELVHRLDRDTSGCLVLAKTRAALRQLHSLLREEGSAGIDKRYLALVQGSWRAGKRDVNLPLHKNVLSSGERRVKVSREGKASLSVFRPIVATSLASLMEIQLLTGRTHQARVHAAQLNFPIAGDDKYGEEVFNRQLREQGLKRLFLHAWRLEFSLQDPHQTISVCAPLDEQLQQVLQRLGISFDITGLIQ
ncbi:MAG: RluA family pseudouridine synthase [Gammaproteobacteria bacterium]|nr:RluA family pseudouridine synthase [Gammaproteobacteria bacterium]